MLKRLCVTACLGLAATPALALSCLAPSVTDSFNAANEREETFVMAVGEMTRTGPDTARPDAVQTGAENLPAPYSFPARFSGLSAMADGFVNPLEVDVTVEVSCVSAWCGTPPLDSYALFFLREDDEAGVIFETDPCARYSYMTPTEQDLTEVMGCALGDACGGAN
ncbi:MULTISPECIES: hypothetical protein [Paracoccaceae]|uniref:hypothetical protein n=1 Tax=Rhodobacterales TaxID=204455 RepID=UPI001D0A725E|nr:hypothetical protein [Boseongicola sp. H5]